MNMNITRKLESRSLYPCCLLFLFLLAPCPCSLLGVTFLVSATNYLIPHFVHLSFVSHKGRVLYIIIVFEAFEFICHRHLTWSVIVCVLPILASCNNIAIIISITICCCWKHFNAPVIQSKTRILCLPTTTSCRYIIPSQLGLLVLVLGILLAATSIVTATVTTTVNCRLFRKQVLVVDVFGNHPRSFNSK